MKNFNWFNFIIYLVFLLACAIGIGANTNNINNGLIIFGFGGLLYLFIDSVVHYLDGK